MLLKEALTPVMVGGVQLQMRDLMSPDEVAELRNRERGIRYFVRDEVRARGGVVPD